MSEPNHNTDLQSLISLGLITTPQRDAALAHPMAHELGSVTGLSNTIAWMVVRDVFPEEEFNATRSVLRSRFSGDEYRQREKILDDALESVRLAKQNLSFRALNPLLEAGLIDEAQHEAALNALPVDETFASPAAVLVWMVAVAEVITWEQWQALHDKATTADETVRRQILAEADQLLEQLRKASHKAAVSVFWRNVFPGPPWLWVGGALLAIAVAVWYLVVPSSVPECNSSQITRTVNAMLFSTHIQLRSDVMRGGQSLPEGAPRLKDVREVGYAKADKVRGCAGTLDYGNAPMPYAFTIKPGSGENGKEASGTFVVTGADRRMVEARYGHIDAQGNYAQQAAPIGRAKLEDALRAGVEAFNRNVGRSASDRLLQGVLGQRQQRRLGSADPDRQREIAEVEPLAPCREVAAATRYACRLLVERNDPLLKALGRAGSQLLEAEFTFERDGSRSSGEWRVSEEFPREFAEAIAQARLASLKASPPKEEAAAKE